jgi:hypothetical protein
MHHRDREAQRKCGEACSPLRHEAGATRPGAAGFRIPFTQEEFVRTSTTVMLGALLALPMVAGAQGRPPGWQTRLDGNGHAAGDTVAFELMRPGFHVTTGPAAILWHPDSTANGEFTVESVLHLFDTRGRDREGYGVFVGGRDLSADAQAYTYFLLRNDGRYLIKQRRGGETPTLVPWTEHASIVKWTPASGSSVKNVLTVRAAGDSVRFSVNGQVVQTLPRAQVSPDGVFGVRANHSVNLHVEKVARATS